MNEHRGNGPIREIDVAQPIEQGDTLGFSADEFVEFIEERSVTTSEWPWPEPPVQRPSIDN